MKKVKSAISTVSHECNEPVCTISKYQGKNKYNKDISRVTWLLKEYETSDGATQQDLECTRLLWPQP